MSNSRSLRRRIAARQAPKTGHRFPDRPPSLSSVRRWMRQAEAEGLMERTGETEHTGKPGRPAQTWRHTEAGKALRAQDDPRDALSEIQAQRARALMHRGMSEKQAIAAVTKGWRKPRKKTQP